MDRKYDLGQGITITDNGSSIRAEWSTGEHSSHSIGIVRPGPMPVPDQVKVVFSRQEHAYYLLDYCRAHRAWLSTEVFQGKPEGVTAESIFGPGCVGFFNQGGLTHYRKVWDFAMWDIKSGETRPVDRTDALVVDALICEQQESRDDERRFNKALAFSGWTYKEILNKIGPWVPVEEPPLIKLEK
jgi:hypothetical protein